MAKPTPARFSEVVHIKAPPGLCSCIQELAAREHTTSAEWTRRALISACKQAGLSLSGRQARTNRRATAGASA
jgi:hypothetical protein